MRRAVLALGIIILGACTARIGSDTVQGGELRVDASEPPVIATPGPGNTGVGAATFTSLYADFFGPKGAATCGLSACHSKATDGGAIATGGFVCAPDQTECHRAMVSAAAKLTAIPPGKTGADAFLHTKLRKVDAAGTIQGTMPQNRSYTFTAPDLARIAAWLEAGAKND